MIHGKRVEKSPKQRKGSWWGGGEIKVNILRADLETMPEGFGGAISGWAARESSLAKLYKSCWLTSLVEREVLTCDSVRNRCFSFRWQPLPILACAHRPFSGIFSGHGLLPERTSNSYVVMIKGI